MKKVKSVQKYDYSMGKTEAIGAVLVLILAFLIFAGIQFLIQRDIGTVEITSLVIGIMLIAFGAVGFVIVLWFVGTKLK
jgi:hypothetical protein